MVLLVVAPPVLNMVVVPGLKENLRWHSVMRPRPGILGVIGSLRLDYGHRRPIHRRPRNFPALNVEGILTGEKLVVLHFGRVNVVLVSLPLVKLVRLITRMCYRLLRSRPRLTVLLYRGVRLQNPRSERVVSWPMVNICGLAS